MPGIPNNRFVILERQQKVFSMLSHGLTESEIARQLNVDQSTICRDIKRLRRNAQRSIEAIAKDIMPLELAKSIHSVNNIIKECWNIYQDNSGKWTNKDKLSAMKLVKDSERTRVEILIEGPMTLLVQQMGERLTKIENNENVQKNYFMLPAIEKANNDVIDLR